MKIEGKKLSEFRLGRQKHKNLNLDILFGH